MGTNTEWDQYSYFGTTCNFENKTRTIKDGSVHYMCESSDYCYTLSPLEAWTSCIHLMDGDQHLGAAVVCFVWTRVPALFEKEEFIYALDQHDMTLNEVAENISVYLPEALKGELHRIAYISNFEVYKDHPDLEGLRTKLIESINHCFCRNIAKEPDAYIFDIDLELPPSPEEQANILFGMDCLTSNGAKVKVLGTKLEQISPFESRRLVKKEF